MVKHDKAIPDNIFNNLSEYVPKALKVLQITATVIAFFLLAKYVNFEHIYILIVKNDLRLIILAVFLIIIAMMIMSYKMYVLLASRIKLNIVTYSYALSILHTLIGGMLVSDVLRSIYLGKQEHDSIAIAGGLFYDKITNIFIILLAAIFFTPFELYPDAIKYSALVVLTLCVLILSYYLLRKRRDSVNDSNKPAFFSGFLNKFNYFLNIDRRTNGNIFVLALISYVFSVSGLWLIAMSYDFTLPFTTWIGVLAVITLCQLIPFTIAGLGVRESAFYFCLKPYGLDFDTAVAISLSRFIIIMGVATLIILYTLGRQRIKPNIRLVK